MVKDKNGVEIRRGDLIAFYEGTTGRSVVTQSMDPKNLFTPGLHVVLKRADGSAPGADSRPVLGKDSLGRDVRKGDKVRCNCGGNARKSCPINAPDYFHTQAGSVVESWSVALSEFHDNNGHFVTARFALLVTADPKPVARYASGEEARVGDVIESGLTGDHRLKGHATVTAVKPERLNAELGGYGPIQPYPESWRLVRRAHGGVDAPLAAAAAVVATEPSVFPLCAACGNRQPGALCMQPACVQVRKCVAARAQEEKLRTGYDVFSRVVREVAKSEAPRAQVVTDMTHGNHDAPFMARIDLGSEVVMYFARLDASPHVTAGALRAYIHEAQRRDGARVMGAK